MILICGLPSEPSIKLITGQLDTIGAKYLLWNQRKFSETDISFFLTGTGCIAGSLQYFDKEYNLDEITVVYSRLIDWTVLPEIERNTVNVKLREKCEQIHALMQLFIDNSKGEVIDCSESMISNNSKPYQMFLAKESGINIPDTCITTSEAIALNFYEEKQNQVFHKSISDTRFTVQKLQELGIPGIGGWFDCPAQFQEVTDGQNAYVDVINEVTITSPTGPGSTYFRNFGNNGIKSAGVFHSELEADKKSKCVRLNKHLRGFISRIECKQNKEGDLIFLDLDPMPDLSHYEQSVSQLIAYTLACELQKIDEKNLLNFYNN